MNRPRSVAALVTAMSCFAMACEKGSTPEAQQGVPSQREVDRALAKGPANAGGPFEINVTGAKTGNASGRDATFCVSKGEMVTFSLSMVERKWAVSVGGLGDRPAVGQHALISDMSKGLTAQLMDKTTGTEPQEWGYHDATSGTLTITRSDDSKLEGTYELTAAPSSGGELRAKGKFEANPCRAR